MVALDTGNRLDGGISMVALQLGTRRSRTLGHLGGMLMEGRLIGRWGVWLRDFPNKVGSPEGLLGQLEPEGPGVGV